MGHKESFVRFICELFQFTNKVIINFYNIFHGIEQLAVKVKHDVLALMCI